jgi:hypothetical protein
MDWNWESLIDERNHPSSILIVNVKYHKRYIEAEAGGSNGNLAQRPGELKEPTQEKIDCF